MVIIEKIWRLSRLVRASPLTWSRRVGYMLRIRRQRTTRNVIIIGRLEFRGSAVGSSESAYSFKPRNLVNYLLRRRGWVSYYSSSNITVVRTKVWSMLANILYVLSMSMRRKNDSLKINLVFIL